MKIWSDKEVVSLFRSVENCKQTSQAIKSAFVSHAEKFGRKSNSVRNYYYHEIDNLKNNHERCKKLQINIKNHTKNQFVAFDKDAEELLMKEIEQLTSLGQSVRSACQKLSNGDLSLMTRLQNKYQNLKRQKQESQNNNVIMFRQKQNVLTEHDINSLFMGLVRLIKKSAVEDFMEKTKLEKQSSTFLLKKTFLDLSKKEKQIAQLREEFNILKKENEKLVEKLNFLDNSKTQILKTHLSKNKIENMSEIKKV